MDKNIDKEVVSDFGDEWKKFNYRQNTNELKKIFIDYFDIFPKEIFNKKTVGFDLGCGTGRWARIVAPLVGNLNCIDPSEKAINEAKENLSNLDNCKFICDDIKGSRIKDFSQDFGYSLGVLHHIPDTQGALSESVKKLKLGAPFLAYFYYSFENKPVWYRIIWKISDILRKCLSKAPFSVKYFISQIVAIFIYYPFARICRIFDNLSINVTNFPLNYYKDKSFYVMRTDALDRLGTKLEKRFSKSQITEMFIHAGLDRIEFSSTPPFWCAIGFRKN